MRKITRRQSDPTSTPPSAQQASSDTATLDNTSPPVVLNPSPPKEHAAALTRMSYEIGLSHNRSLAEKLEEQIRCLRVAVADEKDFHRQNGERLDRLERRIEAVKMESEKVQQTVASQQEQLGKATAFTAQCVKQVEEMKDAFHDLETRIEHFEETGDHLRSQLIMSKVETRSTAKAAVLQFAQQQNEASMYSKRARIKETIRSTQRWNLEHRRTTLPDSQFATNYFKKQAKRDPEVARIIQKSLKQRIRRRQHGRLRSLPQNLEEFCMDVKWRDILETAEEVLGRGEEKTLRMLK